MMILSGSKQYYGLEALIEGTNGVQGYSLRDSRIFSKLDFTGV